MHSSATDELLFFMIHGIEWATHLLATTGLHFGKDKGVMVTTDKIDLTATRCPEVPAEDLPTKSLQVTCGNLLTPLAQRNMVRNRR